MSKQGLLKLHLLDCYFYLIQINNLTENLVPNSKVLVKDIMFNQ